MEAWSSGNCNLWNILDKISNPKTSASINWHFCMTWGFFSSSFSEMNFRRFDCFVSITRKKSCINPRLWSLVVRQLRFVKCIRQDTALTIWGKVQIYRSFFLPCSVTAVAVSIYSFWSRKAFSCRPSKNPRSLK